MTNILTSYNNNSILTLTQFTLHLLLTLLILALFIQHYLQYITYNHLIITYYHLTT